MKYLLLIYEDEKARARYTDSERQKISGEYLRLTEEMKQSGKYQGGNPLQPTSTAMTVRVSGDKPLVIDGPFAETKEQLGGYYLIDATDIDDAIKIAAKIPAARTGSVEVRPIMEM